MEITLTGDGPCYDGADYDPSTLSIALVVFADLGGYDPCTNFERGGGLVARIILQNSTSPQIVTFATPGSGTYSACELIDGEGTYPDIGVLVIGQAAPLTATVTGTQAYGDATAAFSETNNAPSGVTVSGNVTCTRVTGGQAIGPALPAGTYTIDPSSCSGLTVSAGYTLTYSGGTFTVAKASQAISFTAPATGAAPGTATLTATGGGSGNPVVFSVDPSSGTGVCSVDADTVTYLAAGTCVIDANQAGDSNYLAAPQVSQVITVNRGPVFTQDTPPLLASAHLRYRYQFIATGVPAPRYSLRGAPGWLHINPRTGLVSGTPPNNVKPFAYTVTATNSLGSATAGPFTVGAVQAADVSVALSCPAAIRSGRTGTCTVTVTDKGPGQAIGTITGVTLPDNLYET